MENGKKKNLMRFFGVCLALTLCTSAIDSRLLFPVSAEGEEVTAEDGSDGDMVDTVDMEIPQGDGSDQNQDTVETESPAEREPGQPTPIEGEGQEPEETPGEVTSAEEEVKSEEADKPSMMTVAKLETKAAEAPTETTRISVKTTEGEDIKTASGIQSLKLGWVKSAIAVDDLNINGQRHFTFKDVEVDGKPVLYTAIYNGDIFYSYDGASGKLLTENQTLNLIYWEYFNVKINVEGEGSGQFQFDSQMLQYPTVSSNTALKELQAESYTDLAETARVYKSQKFNWSVAGNVDKTTGSKYVINEIFANDVELPNKDIYKNGGSFSEDVNGDTTFTLVMDVNKVVSITNQSSVINNLSPKSFAAPKNTSPIKFNISIDWGEKIKKIYLKSEEGVFEFDVATSDLQQQKQYFVKITKQSSRSYQVQIGYGSESGPVYSDLSIYTDNESAVSSLTTHIKGTKIDAAIYQDNKFTKLVSDKNEIHKLNNFLGIAGSSKATIFYKAMTGYKLDDPIFTTKYENYYSIKNGLIDNYTGLEIPSSAITSAKQQGFTHYFYVEKTYRFGTSDCRLELRSSLVNIRLERTDSSGGLKETLDTNIEDQKTLLLSTDDIPSEMVGKRFAGYSLNGKTEILYPGGSEFVVTEDNWSLGELISGVQVFKFTAQYHDVDQFYYVHHHKQTSEGVYIQDPDETLIGVAPGTTGVVVGIPKEYAGYTFDAGESQKTMGIELIDGKPVDQGAAIHLYYSKNIEYADVTVSNTVSGELSDTTKQFKYTIKVEKINTDSKVFPVDKSLFNSSDSATFTLSSGEGRSFRLPVNNCKYTITQDNYDFYTTTVNGTDGNSIIIGLLQDNSTNNVEFKNTASDVVPAGNLFDDTGFDLMLSATAVLGLLCVIYFILKKRIQA